jgi:hypothetical protein
MWKIHHDEHEKKDLYWKISNVEAVQLWRWAQVELLAAKLVGRVALAPCLDARRRAFRITVVTMGRSIGLSILTGMRSSNVRLGLLAALVLERQAADHLLHRAAVLIAAAVMTDD